MRLPNRTRSRVAPAAAVLLLTVAAVGAMRLTASGDGDVLDTGPHVNISGAQTASVGQLYTFGLYGIRNTGDAEVRFRDVRPVGAPAAMVFDAIRAIHNCPPAPLGLLGFEVGTVEGERPDLTPRPITEAVIPPGADSCWYFAATVHATELGKHLCPEFELVYTTGGRERRHRLTNGIELEVTTTDPDPRANQPR